MMDWTDRHCRYLHRLMSRHVLVYSEMVTAPAVIHGDRDRLIGYGPAEHPVALQLGGSDPALLAQAARLLRPGRRVVACGRHLELRAVQLGSEMLGFKLRRHVARG